MTNPDKTHEEPAHDNEQLDVKYQCPMHCEGDKVYDQPGRCPVCKMNLVPVKPGEGN
jgi:hypothetical protein